MSPFFRDDDNGKDLLDEFESYMTPPKLSMKYRDNVFGDIIQSQNDVQNNSYERYGDTNT